MSPIFGSDACANLPGSEVRQRLPHFERAQVGGAAFGTRHNGDRALTIFRPHYGLFAQNWSTDADMPYSLTFTETQYEQLSPRTPIRW